MREARDRFVALLEQSESLEHQWQELFEEFPFILTEYLPLAIAPHNLIPCNPGQAEADFYFYPEPEVPSSPYGVIELKRPSTALYRESRKGIICLAADAHTAVRQAQEYAERLKDAVAESFHTLIVGNPLHMFVIAGLERDYRDRLSLDLVHSQSVRFLPPGCELIPYDVLNEAMSSRLPPRFHLLVCVAADVLDSTTRPDRFVFGPRKLYETECTDCGKEMETPIVPKGHRQIWCSDCYSKRRGIKDTY